jgi:hypothetical protein
MDHPGFIDLVNTESRLREAPERAVPASPSAPQAGVRAALEGRLVDCWDRLEDVVSELVALHEAPEELIVARVRRTVDLEHASPVR